jgi:hypothetical protein
MWALTLRLTARFPYPRLCNIEQAFTNIHVSPMRFIQASAGA